MIIGIKKLHEMVAQGKLVEGLCDREKNNPEGAGFDLRLGEVFKLEGEGFLGIEERDTPNSISVAKFDAGAKDDKSFYIFEPREYRLVQTIERVNLPSTVSGIIVPRTTLFRSGLGLFNGIVQPGYSGELTFSICNFGPNPVKISMGARVVHITFHEVLGEGNQYRGQWQGGRVSTEKKERQV